MIVSKQSRMLRIHDNGISLFVEMTRGRLQSSRTIGYLALPTDKRRSD